MNNFTSTTNTSPDEPLTAEKFLETIQNLRSSLPSFEELDKDIEKGHRIDELVLVVYSEEYSKETIATKYGPLLIQGCPWVEKEAAHLITVKLYDGLYDANERFSFK